MQYNNSEIINVCAEDIVATSSGDVTEENNVEEGKTFKNGLYGSWSKKLSWSGANSDYLNGDTHGLTHIDKELNGLTISIKPSSTTGNIATIDELGAPSGAFISLTRVINYGKNANNDDITNEQVIYTEVKYLANSDTYYYNAISEPVTNNAENRLEQLKPSSSSNNGLENITINGKKFAFVSDSQGFITALNTGISSTTITYSGTLEEEKISDLANNNYTFDLINITAYADDKCTQLNNNVGNISYDITVNNDQLQITIYYTNNDDSSAVYFKYDLIAQKESQSESISLKASNLFIDENKKQIKIDVSQESFLNALNEGQNYTITYQTDIGAVSQIFKYNEKHLIFESEDDKYEEIYNQIVDNTITINLNEGETITQTYIESVNKSDPFVTSNNEITNSEINFSVSDLSLSTWTKTTQNPADEDYVVSSNIEKLDPSNNGTAYKTLKETIVLKGRISSVSVKDNGKYLSFGEFTIYQGDSSKWVSLKFGNLGLASGTIGVSKFSYDEQTDTTTIEITAIADDLWIFNAESQNDFEKLNFTFNFYQSFAEDDHATYSYAYNKDSNNFDLIINAKEGFSIAYQLNDKIKGVNASDGNREIAFSNITSSSVIKKYNFTNFSDEDASYSFRYDFEADKFDLIINVKDDVALAYEYNQITQAINNSDQDRQIILENFTNFDSTILKYKVLSTEYDQVTYLTDENKILTGLSINVNSGYSAIYKLQQNDDELKECLTSSENERNLTFALTSLKNLTISKDVLNTNPISSIAIERDDVTFDSDDQITVTAEEVVPYFVESNFAEISVNDGKFVYNGVEYEIEIQSDGIDILIDGKTANENTGLFDLNGSYCLVVYDGDSDAVKIAKAYKGEDGIIKIDEQTFVKYYVIQSDNEYAIIFNADNLSESTDESGEKIYTINSTKFFAVEDLVARSETYKTTFDGNKLTISGNLYKSDILNLVLETEAEAINEEINLIHDTYEVVVGKYIESIEVSINNNSSEVTSQNEIFGPYSDETTLSLITNYKSFTNQSLINQATSTKAIPFEGIVVLNDIDVGFMESAILGVNDINGNGYFINFISKDSALFRNTNTGTDKYIKDFNAAGSVINTNDSDSGAGIISAKTLGATLKNVSSYGTINVNKEKKIRAGGIAASLTGKNHNNVKNFASLSNFVKEGYYYYTRTFIITFVEETATIRMAGIAWDMNVGSDSSKFTNYGTIIGIDGTNGSNRSDFPVELSGGNGYTGEHVYAISASNVGAGGTVYNYGIVKAGDGGNGGRGSNGYGGTDKTNGSAPESGNLGGTGGSAGAAGTAYLYAQTPLTNSSNSSKVFNGKPGVAGKKGNDGWGGYNLYLYNFTNFQKKVNKGSEDIVKWDVYHNDISETNTNMTTVYVKYMLGSYADKTELNTEICSDENLNTWLEIQYKMTWNYGNYAYDKNWDIKEINNTKILFKIEGTIYSTFFGNYYLGQLGAVSDAPLAVYVYSFGEATNATLKSYSMDTGNVASGN